MVVYNEISVQMRQIPAGTARHYPPCWPGTTGAVFDVVCTAGSALHRERGNGAAGIGGQTTGTARGPGRQSQRRGTRGPARPGDLGRSFAAVGARDHPHLYPSPAQATWPPSRGTHRGSIAWLHAAGPVQRTRLVVVRVPYQRGTGLRRRGRLARCARQIVRGGSAMAGDPDGGHPVAAYA